MRSQTFRASVKWSLPYFSLVIKRVIKFADNYRINPTPAFYTKLEALHAKANQTKTLSVVDI